jgi:hypothetical protein
MTPIAAWLKAARLAQTNPETGRPWSQAYLAERVTAEMGWTLYREAYVGYEQGKGMLPETLARFVAFWAKYGVAGPDLSEQKPALSLEERAVKAAEDQARAMEEANEIARAQLNLMRLLVPADRAAELAAFGAAWAAPLLARTPQRLPDPTGQTPER